MAVSADSGSIAFETGGTRIDWAAAQAPKMAGSVCGDGYLLRRSGSRLMVALADGVGSGQGAQAAANACLEALATVSANSIAEVFETAHERVLGTRGAALAVALIDPELAAVEWAAVGDVEGVICALPPDSEGSSAILQKGGTLGVQFPGVLPQIQPFPPNHILVLASDGVSRRFRDALPTARMPPQEWVASCLATYGKDHDDRTVLALSHQRRSP
ncbi:serine/threonine-protein phosphatase [Leisingera aquaemixtae]|uniref:serine/threonine-protein phosphatase n=1 Tax=Leisingera aquaemixtae TaxID=1396826 RepID=UPI0021A7A82A|nr:serine/threonine-protein phosphatase [Leisingera aquaemixtae]UWQ25714.1 serine/threonine-protein phosphatase [Leisingera aquaemixtae]